MARLFGGSYLLVTVIILIHFDKVGATEGDICTSSDSSNCTQPSEQCDIDNNKCICSAGYSISDNSCIGIECQDLTVPSNGSIAYSQSGATIRYPASATYSCDTGYQLSGQETRSCQTDGSWDGTEPTCEDVDCSTAPALDNGFRSNGGATTFGSTATYQCSPGYTISGDNSITCQSNGVWETLSAVCTIKDCSTAPALENGFRSNGGATTFGSTATYQCSPGYTISGDNSITCQSNGVWETLSAVCTIKDCSTAPALENGFRSNGGATTFGSTATYQCSPGYTISGDNSITCQSNGVWETLSAVCTIKDCSTAPALENGFRSNGGATTFGSTATYQCSPGYTISGDNSITCQSNGVWETLSAVCTIKDCSTAPALENGFRSNGGATTFGSTATYQCSPGYTISGDNSITCQSNGVWETLSAVCTIKDCSTAPALENGFRSNGGATTFGSTATYQCSPGYTISGDNSITCQSNGVWETLSAVCTIKDCSTAPTLANGFRSGGGATTYNATATYQCDAGYTIFGDTSIKCQFTGSWETLSAVCYKDCPAAPTLTNGNRSNGGATIFGSTATYTCNSGYTISGDNSITCQSNGVWETLGATCTIKDCGSLGHPTNGNVNVGSTTYNSIATYTCNTGYYKSAGDSSRQCGPDGAWSGSQPTCSIIPRSLGETCDFDENCEAVRVNARCSETFICVCKDTYYDDDGPDNQSGNCRPRKALDVSCGISPAVLDQCSDVQASCQPVTTGSTSYSCLCNSGYHPEGTECVANKPLGDNCSSAADCSDPYAGCLGSPTVCTCKAGYYDDNNKDTSGGNCLSMSQLRVQNIRFTTIGITSVTVVWDPPSGKTQYVDEYTVHWQGQITSHSEGPFSNGKNTQRTLSALIPGEAYNVTITSVNRQTASDERTTSVTKEQATKPNKPGSLNRNTSDFDASDSTITLKWQANIGDSVRSYSVRVSGDGISKTASPGTVSASFSTTGMKNGFTYSVSIVAKSQVYNDGTSNTQENSEEYTDTFKTTVKVPGPPRNVQCKESTDSSQTLTWTVPQFPNGDIEEYRIDTYFHSNGSLVSSNNTSSSQTTGTVLNLQPGSYYRFRVYTINEAFTSTSPGAPPTYCATRAKMSAAPNSVTLTDRTSRTLTVSWTPPTDTFGEHLGSSIKVGTTDDACVFEYIQKCSDCTGQFPSGTDFPASGCQNVSGNNPVTASVLGGQQTYTVEELLPDINYTVSVMAVNAAGRGHAAVVYGLTLEEAPQKPYSLISSNVASTSFTLSWNIPGPRPGDTTFNITLTPLAPAEPETVIVTGFEKRTTEITDLEEYWLYTVTITAVTSIGSATIDTALNVTTYQAAPGQVDPLEFLHNTNTYRDVTVSWQMSNILQRNGIIERLVFVTNATQNETEIEYDVPFNDSLQFVYSMPGKVQPEKYYIYQVYAVNKDKGNGQRRTEIVKAPAGPPPSFTEDADTPLVALVSEPTTTTITLNFPNVNIFTNNQNGRVQEHGLLVAPPSKAERIKDIDTLPKFQGMKTWNEASTDGFISAYRATASDWTEIEPIGDRRRRDTTFTYTLGSENCDDASSDDFCNGPLPEDTSFVIVLIACTDGGCTQSQSFGPYKTAKVEPPGAPVGAIVGGVVGGLVAVLVAVFLVLFIIWRRRRTMEKPDNVEVPDLMEKIKKKRPITLEDVPDHVVDLHKDSNLKFSDEYEDLKKLTPPDQHPRTASEREENRLKNRYINILPYDHSRVKLSSVDDDESSDYINANYLPGYNSQREYIACQGPIPATIDDMWRLIWEQNVTIIVMLTLCKEESRIKCEQYWPSETGDPKQYGDIVVETLSVSNISVYECRVFRVKQGNLERQVKHFHFLSWKDFSANVRNDVVISFIEHVRNHVQPDAKGPLIVHCSAGVGRTGTYIAIDHLIQLVKEHDLSTQVDIFDMVYKMRDNRPYMVQTEQQYIFIHDCLKEIVEDKKRRLLAESENYYANAGAADGEHIYGNQGFEPDNTYVNVDFTMKTEL